MFTINHFDSERYKHDQFVPRYNIWVLGDNILVIFMKTYQHLYEIELCCIISQSCIMILSCNNLENSVMS